MDAEDVITIFVFLSFLSLPVIIILSVTGCIAYSNTRTWQKEKSKRLLDAESLDPLVSKQTTETDDLEQQDLLDSEDEAEYREKQEEEAEKEADWKLTPRQKFKKEFKKCWSGKANVEKEREKTAREERRKVAKEVVREMMRLERKMGRKMQFAFGGSDDDATLPTYKKE